MKIEYANFSYENLDPYLHALQGQLSPGQRVTIKDGVDFVCLDLSRPGSIPRIKAEDSSGYRVAFERWLGFKERFLHWPIGYFIFKNVTCISPNGAIVDTRQGKFYIGQCIGWSIDFVEFFLGTQGSFSKLGENTFTFEGDSEIKHVSEGLVISGPGYDIFGHHLVDYMPRSWIIEKFGLAKDRTPMRQRMPQWATELTRPLRNFDNDMILNSKELVHVDNLVIPTLPKLGAWTDVEYGLTPIRMTRDHYAPVSTVKLDKLCISRSKWSPNQRIGGSVQWDTHFIEKGFNVIHPQDWDLATQISVFRGAKEFAGLDGSGLHAALFADTLERIIVVHGERTNYLHFTVASLFPDVEIELIDARVGL